LVLRDFIATGGLTDTDGAVSGAGGGGTTFGAATDLTGTAFDLVLGGSGARFGFSCAGVASAVAPVSVRGDRAVAAFALAAFAILTLPPRTCRPGLCREPFFNRMTQAIAATFAFPAGPLDLRAWRRPLGDQASIMRFRLYGAILCHANDAGRHGGTPDCFRRNPFISVPIAMAPVPDDV
jgi:hypothetical protein